MTQLMKQIYTVEEYFTLEKESETKNEYHNGEIIPMAGASINHLRINGNLYFQLRLNFVGRKNCEAFSNDLKIQVKVGTKYTYPDLVALCGEPQRLPGHNDIITNPTVIIEILSKSTQSYDKTAKFESYKSVVTLQEYVLVSQDEMNIICYRKQPDNSWQDETLTDPQAKLKLGSVNAEVTLSDIYTMVNFAEE
jgi:Uma2 family endonuclease